MTKTIKYSSNLIIFIFKEIVYFQYINRFHKWSSDFTYSYDTICEKISQNISVHGHKDDIKKCL